MHTFISHSVLWLLNCFVNKWPSCTGKNIIWSETANCEVKFLLYKIHSISGLAFKKCFWQKAEKSFDKIQHLLVIKTVSKLGPGQHNTVSQTGGLDDRTSQNSGGCTSGSRELAGLVSPRNSPWLIGVHPSLHPPWSFLCMCLHPHNLFLQGHQPCQTRAHPNDLILT